MFRNLFSLAVQGTLRKRRNSILVFFILLLSFSCAIVSLSLTESMHSTNERLRLDTYGGWYLAIPDGKEGDAAFLAEQNWAEKIGHARLYASLWHETAAFGTVDQSYVSLGRIEPLSGHLPQQPDEIAIEQSLLRSLGYEETLGQRITLSLGIRLADDKETYGYGEFAFTLCGVLPDTSQHWALNQNRSSRTLVNAVVTDEAAQAVWDSIDRGMQQKSWGKAEKPTVQYFVGVSEADQQRAQEATSRYMSTTRDQYSEDIAPAVNYLAFPLLDTSASSHGVFTLLIAAAALTAVFCAYLMQLPDETHRFVVLRSLGVTRRQLLVLMGLESLLLAAPAVALGVPLGALLTRLALRLLAYSDGTAIRVAVPYGELGQLFVLWTAVILLARLVIFLITVRTPLTGRMRLHAGKARRARNLRETLVLLLLAAFGTAALYMLSGSAASFYQKSFYETQPDYILSWKSGTEDSHVVPAELLDTLRDIPGVVAADGFLETHENMKLRYTSESGEVEQSVSFYVLDLNCWNDLPELGEARDAFVRGDLVLLCFPNDFGEDYPKPTGAVTLSALAKGCVIELAADVRVDASRSFNRVVRGQSFAEPYTVIASEKFLKRLLAALPEGGEWADYVGGGTFGYPSVYVDAADSAAELSTGQALQNLCARHSIRVKEQWSAMQQSLQLCKQELIMLFSCGGCVALITLLLLAGTISIETEQERQSVTILRVIGMSKKQLLRRVLVRSLRRGGFAVAFGWAACFGVYVWEEVHSGFYDAAAASAAYFPRLQRLGVSVYAASLTTLACLFAALLVSLLSKRGLKQTAKLK